MRAVLSNGIRAGLVLLLWMPLVVTHEVTLYPFIVGKALYARGLIEVIAALWLLLLLWDPGYRPPRSWVVWTFALYLAVALLSAVLGVSFAHSFWSDYQRMMGVWDLGHWFLLVLVAASVLRSPRAWRSLLNWNLGVALALSLLAVAQALRVPLPPYFAITARCRLDATLDLSPYLAAILMVAILVAVGFTVRSFLPDQGEGGEERGRHAPPGGLGLYLGRAFWMVTAALALWVLFQTGTRGALVGLVAGGVAMPLALAIWGNRGALRPMALGAAAVLLAVAGLWALGETTDLLTLPGCREETASARLAGLVRTVVGEGVGAVEAGSDAASGSVGIRVALIGIGYRAFLARPLLGWGPENFGRAFDRLAEASFYRFGERGQADYPHNKLVEELVTKGALGILSTLALWGALLWALARRRRAPREEVLAYAILGALTAYFVQNLFLFDAPATILQWALLVAWVAGQERATGQEEAKGSVGRQGAEMPPLTPAAASDRAPSRVSLATWGAAALGMFLVLGLSLYYFNYRPYLAGQWFLQAYQEPYSLSQRLALAERSFYTFPGLAPMTRWMLFDRLMAEWDKFSPEERQQALNFMSIEIARGVRAEPGDAQLLRSALRLLQATYPLEQLGRLEPLLNQLHELAPWRVYTHQLLALQELLKGNYPEALRIAEDFMALAPTVKEELQGIVEAAERELNVVR